MQNVTAWSSEIDGKVKDRVDFRHSIHPTLTSRSQKKAYRTGKIETDISEEISRDSQVESFLIADA